MKSQYVFKKNEHYLSLIISGEYDKRDFLSYPVIILEECEKEQIHKVLIDALEVKRTDAPTMDRFLVGEAIANIVGNKIKMAVAWPGQDINRLFENVAVNRGSRVCVLDNINAAEQWLLDNKS